jgi:predicted ribosomally synthesized peptide with SipW-like signal peptide
MLDSRALRALLSLGMVVGLGATGTYAYWTDTATVSGTAISAGTIDLKVNKGVGGDQDNISDYTTMNISTMVPGNSTAGTITVKNNGTAPLNYYVNASGTNTDTKGLAAALTIKVTGDAATGGSGSAKTCPGAALSTATGFGADMLGSAAVPRLLAAGASETLCIQATLPTNASTTLQGATTNVTFTFNGTSF